MAIVGHQILKADGSIAGEAGSAYTYIMTSSGLWIQSEARGIKITMPLAETYGARIRGLGELDYRLELPGGGRIPAQILFDILSTFTAKLPKECGMAVVWSDIWKRYRAVMPEQQVTQASVHYQKIQSTESLWVVVDAHSHNTMHAFFSSTDDADDQGFGISMVAGELDKEKPAIDVRMCVYGHFLPLEVSQVFDVPQETGDDENEEKGEERRLWLPGDRL